MNNVLKIVPQEILCRICDVSKPIAEFHVDKTGTHGRKSRCKVCCNKIQREESYPKNKRLGGYKNRQDVVLRKFGVTYEHVVRTLENQNGLCANIGCGKHISLDVRVGADKAVIDHDHETGKFRSLMCTRCNTLLGHIEKDAGVVNGLMHYLNKHR